MTFISARTSSELRSSRSLVLTSPHCGLLVLMLFAFKCQTIKNCIENLYNQMPVRLLFMEWWEQYLFLHWLSYINTLRPRQNGRHFADDIFKRIFLNKNFWVWNRISLKYVSWCLIDIMTALVQIMDWHRIGDKPLYEAILVCCSDAYMRHLALMS